MMRMWNTFSIGLAAICVFSVCEAELQSGGKTGDIQTGKGHRFACTDYTAGKVFVVSADGEVEWEYETGRCNDLWVLPSGNILFNTGHGAMEVTRDKKVVFSYTSESEVYACQRSEDVKYFETGPFFN